MRSIFVLLAAFRLASAADTALAAYFPPDTKVVFGIHLRNLADGAIFRESAEEIRAGASLMLAQTPLAGLDPLKDVDQVLLASSGEGDKAPAIVVLRGRFHLTLPAGATRYRDVPILEDPKHPEGILAWIDESTLIGGEPALVRDAIDRAGRSAVADAPWLVRMEALRSRYTIWGYGEGLENAAKAGAKPGDLSAVDRFQFGASFERGLSLNAEVHVRSDKDAEQLSATMRLFEGMLQGAKKPANGQMFDLRVEKGALKLSLAIPEAELQKMVKEQRTNLVKAVASGMPSMAPKSPPKPAPSEVKILTNSNGDTISITLPVVKQ